MAAIPKQPPEARYGAERDILHTLAGPIAGHMMQMPTGYIAPEDDSTGGRPDGPWRASLSGCRCWPSRWAPQSRPPARLGSTVREAAYPGRVRGRLEQLRQVSGAVAYADEVGHLQSQHHSNDHEADRAEHDASAYRAGFLAPRHCDGARHD